MTHVAEGGRARPRGPAPRLRGAAGAHRGLRRVSLPRAGRPSLRRRGDADHVPVLRGVPARGRVARDAGQNGGPALRALLHRAPPTRLHQGGPAELCGGGGLCREGPRACVASRRRRGLGGHLPPLPVRHRRRRQPGVPRGDHAGPAGAAAATFFSPAPPRPPLRRIRRMCAPAVPNLPHMCVGRRTYAAFSAAKTHTSRDFGAAPARPRCREEPCARRMVREHKARRRMPPRNVVRAHGPGRGGVRR